MQAFWRDTVEFFPILMSGVALTVIVTIGSLLLSTVLGLVWALMRVSGIGVLTGFSGGLINVIRGIEAIDKGQIEAAQAIGMSWWQTMRRVVLPQAVRIVLPPYGNVMIMMLKDSSQASTITVAELALQGKLIASSTFKNTSVFTLVALMYLTMSIPLILLVRHFEKRAGQK
jgi:polar amino acid transport system permease protein